LPQKIENRGRSQKMICPYFKNKWVIRSGNMTKEVVKPELKFSILERVKE
jgi:hypothetical protein